MTDLDDLIEQADAELAMCGECSTCLTWSKVLAALKQQQAQVQRVWELCQPTVLDYYDTKFQSLKKDILRALDGDA